MPIGGTTQSDAEDPVGNWTFQLMTAAIESDPVWQATKGDYYKLPKEKHPLAGVAFGWSVLGLTGYDLRLPNHAGLHRGTAGSVLLGSAEREGRLERDQSRQDL